MVIVDLYPFEKTITGNATESEIIEKIDIGGIALIRAAAKNFKDVLCISNKEDYDDFIDIYSMSDLEEVAFEFKEKKNRRIRVSTKYPNLTREFFYNKGVTQFSIVKSIGSTEIEPFTGGCELITDITSTGSTLAANNLRIINDGYILKSELCMFIGKTSFKNQGVKKLAKLLSTKY